MTIKGKNGMKKFLLTTSIIAALALASAPASAHPHGGGWGGGGWHHHGWHGGGWGPAVGLGILGAGVAGALATPYYYGGYRQQCWVQQDSWGRPVQVCQ
jgi:hypothetical protein